MVLIAYPELRENKLKIKSVNKLFKIVESIVK
jgi:hypothetical protein